MYINSLSKLDQYGLINLIATLHFSDRIDDIKSKIESDLQFTGV